jgi:hypothetical protein
MTGNPARKICSRKEGLAISWIIRTCVLNSQDNFPGKNSKEQGAKGKEESQRPTSNVRGQQTDDFRNTERRTSNTERRTQKETKGTKTGSEIRFTSLPSVKPLLNSVL